ncbi:DnaJ domain-containing protein [Schnuerera sp. xch1]|uniref:DnaJ domain-containing protein n=1 Tax=Schnuerera sp. xch1 TaxID=2874283 RepID=UPI001CBB0672|nr:DnaJ domain-containing protein [Schnuerera sp. xch1]MBZ2174241.1 DnaJ domain-containing protein [Schnuerera sp. xch1]
MNRMKVLLGKILSSITEVISIVLDILIGIINFTVTLVNTIARGFIALIGMGGCLLLFMLAGPFGILMLLNPYVILTILFFVVFPLLGTKFVSYLKYIKYMLTEYLFDRANYLMYGTNSKYASFSEYGYRYKKAEEARKRKEQQQRQEQQRKEWEERFKQWQEYQNSQRTYDNYRGYRQYTGSNQQAYSNPTTEFKKKYEESCDLLNVSYSADKYQIKLAYRKKAKEYHPDINKSANATEMFQKVNNAYEFLNDDNIRRYKNIN